MIRCAYERRRMLVCAEGIAHMWVSGAVATEGMNLSYNFLLERSCNYA